MGELNRTQNFDIYTEVLESTPCIIVYSSDNLEFSKRFLKSTTTTAREIFDSLMGVHECKIIYRGKDKRDSRRYQVVFLQEQVSMYITVRKLSNGVSLNEFNLNHISDEDVVIPVDPSEVVTINLKIFSDNYENHEFSDFLDEHDLSSSYKEMKNFIKSLESLKEPVREINLEQSKKMWKAYIDGENALNTDKKNLFIVKEVGKIVKEKYYDNFIPTVIIKVQAQTKEEVFTNEILNISSIKYKQPEIIFQNKNKGEILFRGFVDISEEISEEILSASKETCYRTAEKAQHFLSGCLHLQTNENLDEILYIINDELNNFGSAYTFDDQTNTYFLKRDDETDLIKGIIESDYSQTLIASPNTVLTCRFISKADTSQIKNDILSLDGVISVQDPVKGQLLVKTDAKHPLDCSSKIFENLKDVAYRAVFTPTEFDYNIEIEGLIIKDNSYIYTTKDAIEFKNQWFDMHQKVIDAYHNKQYIKKEFYYGFLIMPDKNLLRKMQLTLITNKKIKVKAALGLVEFYPTSEEEYNDLFNIVQNLCESNLDVQRVPYLPSVSIKLLSDDVSYCRKIYNNVLDKLGVAYPSFNLRVKDDDTYRDFDYSFEFNDLEELELFKNSLVGLLQDYTNLLTNEYLDNENGTTLIPFVFDTFLNRKFENKISSGFIGEDVNLIKKGEFDSINEAIDTAISEEYYNIDEIKDLRTSRNQILREALKLGKCISRTLDSIKIAVSQEFSDYMEDNASKNNVSKFIVQEDYLQFPMIGKSSELRRLRNSMLRITNPNGYYPRQKDKIIPPPANPKLSNFLFDPRFAGEYEEDIDVVKKRIKEHQNEKFLNDKQLEAVAKAIAAPDIAIIQGPPGTGKTTVIAEIIWQQILKKPDSKILLTSQTNLAVDNALERLKGKKGIRPARILNTYTDKKVNIVAQRYMLDIMSDWCSNPNDTNSDNGTNLWIDSILEGMTGNEKYASVLEQWKQDLILKDRNTREQFFNAYKSNVNLVAATCSICGSNLLQQVYSDLYVDNENAFDVVIMDEASKATPLEMSVPMVWGKKIIIIGDHKQLPPMMDENNIITSLKKAGEDVLADTIEGFKDSQFEILFRNAARLKPSIVASLDTQYRMHKDIMRTVSHFYSEELQDGLICGLDEQEMDSPNYNLRSSRYHGISIPGLIEPSTHAVWVNVDTFESQPQGSTSYVNTGELKAVQIIMTALQGAKGFNEFIDSQKSREDKEIGVISFYGAQCGKIDDMYKKGLLGKNLPCSVNIDVVDRFQGMERNIVIVSTVRNNNIANMDKAYGFARDIRRINVAFSRARRLLIVVGNEDFFKKHPSYTKSIKEMEHTDIKQFEHYLDQIR